jgi:hypothetical protein
MISNSEHNRIQERINAELAQNSALDKRSATNSVRFAQEVEEVGAHYEDSLEANNDQTALNDINVARLTNKKKQYLQDAIFDKNGAYSFLEDPIEYKKARKRL